MAFFNKNFPFYKQLDSMDCGPTCLRMIARYYGKSYSLQHLREISYIDRAGVSLKGIAEAAEQIGFRTLAVKVSTTPPILMPIWQNQHSLKPHCPVSYIGIKTTL